MARNRKNSNAAVRVASVLKAVLLCLLVGGFGVGYVWQKQQLQILHRQIAQRETEFKQKQAQNGKLERQLATLHSPMFLHARIAELKLGLIQPQPTQIVHLNESVPTQESLSPEASPATVSARLFARRSMAGVGSP